jgi:hypothetical protein
MRDSHVESVISKYRSRSEAGIKKYNTTLERQDLSLTDWLTHLQEELMDATLYTERIKHEVSNQAEEGEHSKAIAWTVRQLQSGPSSLAEVYPCTGGGFPSCDSSRPELRTSIGNVH